MKQEQESVDYIRSQQQRTAEARQGPDSADFIKNAMFLQPCFPPCPPPFYHPYWTFPPYSLPNDVALAKPLPSLDPPCKKEAEEQAMRESSEESSSGQFKERRGRSVRRRSKKFNSLTWSIKENQRYLRFIRQNRGLFDLSIFEKKNLKLNVLMSYKVGSRSAQQCHSHHQKLIQKYGSIDDVIAHYEHDLIAERRKARDTKQQHQQCVKQEQNSEQLR